MCAEGAYSTLAVHALSWRRRSEHIARSQKLLAVSAAAGEPALTMSLNLTGLCGGAEPAADHRDRRRLARGRQAPRAHVDVRLNELDESALSSLLMPMLPVHLLGTEERGAGQRATRSRWRPPTGLALALLTLCSSTENSVSITFIS